MNFTQKIAYNRKLYIFTLDLYTRKLNFITQLNEMEKKFKMFLFSLMLNFSSMMAFY